MPDGRKGHPTGVGPREGESSVQVQAGAAKSLGPQASLVGRPHGGREEAVGVLKAEGG